MSFSRERVVTRVLAALCLLGGSAVMLPRLGVAQRPLEVLQPAITVAIRGEVAEPGVYSLPFGARIADLVAVAGGALPSAAVALVSLADPLTDGESVLMPGIAAADGRGARVSLNGASLSELDTLPGVGPVVAARIVAHRPYDNVDDLLRVPGVGQKTLERLRPLVTL